MSKRALRDLAKFRGEAKIKSDQEDLYNFVREHVKIEPDEGNVRICAIFHASMSVPQSLCPFSDLYFCCFGRHLCRACSGTFS